MIPGALDSGTGERYAPPLSPRARLRELFGACAACHEIKLGGYLTAQSLWLGLHLLLIERVFASNPLYAGLLAIMPEATWGALFVGAALAKLWGYAYGRPRVRFVASIALTALWSMLWWGLARHDRRAVAFPMTTTLVIAQMYVAAHITRGALFRAPPPLRAIRRGRGA